MEIPEHIQQAAREVCRKVEAMPSCGNAFIVADEIWRRVLAERRRCANIAEQADIDNATTLWVKYTILSGEPQ